mmetsp:Transcript_94429/g.177782  ORF Transcript_94429/g.177782 Transcript_94429/m.177782 type:complete len:237 (-) Transcript_94429:26-736(-)
MKREEAMIHKHVFRNCLIAEEIHICQGRCLQSINGNRRQACIQQTQYVDIMLSTEDSIKGKRSSEPKVRVTVHLFFHSSLPLESGSVHQAKGRKTLIQILQMVDVLIQVWLLVHALAQACKTLCVLFRCLIAPHHLFQLQVEHIAELNAKLMEQRIRFVATIKHKLGNSGILQESLESMADRFMPKLQHVNDEAFSMCGDLQQAQLPPARQVRAFTIHSKHCTRGTLHFQVLSHQF